MSVLAGDFGKAKSAASLLLTGPGVPFLYYGEEVGQRGGKPDENLRTPMQWSAEANAGFTSADLPWRKPQSDFADFNVADQRDDPDSLLSHYRSLIQIRNKHLALSHGKMLQLPTANRGVYAFLRYQDDQTLMVLINLTRNPISDYRFCLNDAGLSGDISLELIYPSNMTEISLNTPVYNALGGFDDYRPIDELAPYNTYIIKLK
jgi:glycosidase